MSEFLTSSAFFGSFITLATFCFALFVYKRIPLFFFSPLLLSSALCIASLLFFKIPYEQYKEGAGIIHNMLTPVTVALAVPLYKQFQKLKDNYPAIIIGLISGIIANAVVIFASCAVLKIGHTEYVSLLPKSITTAIALAVTEQNGGIVSVTILMVTISGNIANLFAVQLARFFRITEPVAKGVAIGTSGHALGTAKAIAMGEVEGSMSGLSIAVCGVLTVVIIPFFVNLI